jgi:hypothetical protein
MWSNLIAGILILLLEYKSSLFVGLQRDSFDKSWNSYLEKPFPWNIGRILKKKLLTVEINSILKSHVGKRVKWYVSFNIMNMVSADITEAFFSAVLMKVLFITIPDKSTYISCHVNLERYPQFKDLYRGEKMWIKGEILSLEDMGSLVVIRIDNADFKFDK